MRCLEKDPDQRFQSAKELRDELMRCSCAGGWTRQDAAEWWKAHLVTASNVSALTGESFLVGDTHEVDGDTAT